MSERFHQPADVPAIERRRRFRRGRRTLWVDQESRRRLPGFVSRRAATDAAAYEGRCLRQGLLDKTNTAGGVWADIAYRSAANETFLNKNGFVSHIHRKKPKGRATPETMRRAKKPNRKSARVSSMCSRSKRIGWGYSSELSGSPEQRPRSEWPISSTTSTLYLPAQDRRRMTDLC